MLCSTRCMVSARHRDVLVPTATAALFGGSYVAAKFATFDLGPLSTTLFRYIIALGLLAGWGICSGRLRLLRVQRRDWMAHACMGLLGIVGYHYFFFVALKHTQIANTSIINALSPACTAVLAMLFIRERLSSTNYAGVLIGVAGVLLLVTKGHLGGILQVRINSGDGLMLVSVVCWAVYALFIKRQSARYDSFALTFSATAWGVVALVFLAWPEGLWHQARQLTVSSALAVIYMGIAASGIGYLLYNVSIARIGPTRTSGIVYTIVPFVVVALGWIVFSEPVTPVMAISAVMVVIGLYLVNQRGEAHVSARQEQV